MDTVLISGGRGRLGRAVLRNWAVKEYQAISPQRDECDFRDGSSVERVLQIVRPRVLLHLAWTASSTPDYRMHVDNEAWVGATLNVVKSCMSHGTHPVIVGSAVDDSSNDEDAYVRAKAILRSELNAVIESGAVTWARPFYVLDFDDPWPRVLRSLIAARDSGQIARLTYPDRGQDFIHIEDVAAGLGLVAAAQPGGVVDIGSGTLHTPRDIANRLGTTCQSGVVPQPCAGAIADIGPLTALGWAAHKTKEWFAE